MGPCSTSLLLGDDAHGRERQHRMPGIQLRPAERDVPYDPATMKRDQAKLRHMGAGGAQRVCEVRFFPRRSESPLVHANGGEVCGVSA